MLRGKKNPMRPLPIALIMIVSFTGFVAVNSPTAKAAPPLGLSWSLTAPVPQATAEAAVVTGNDGRIYVFGGYSSAPNYPSNVTARAYDPKANTWTTLASLPQGTRGAAATVGKTGLIYVIAGVAGGVGCCLNNNQVYNTTSNTWASKAVIPSGVFASAAATGDDGRIYVFGGSKNTEGNSYTYANDFTLSLVQIYNPQTDTWTTGNPMPTGRWEQGAVKAQDGLIYVMGGINNNTVTPYAIVERYDPYLNSWTPAAPMPRPSGFFGSTLGPDGLIYVFGGSRYWGIWFGGRQYNTVEAYDPTSNTWYDVGTMPSRTQEDGAALAPDGRMFVIGGANATSGGLQVSNIVQVATINWGSSPAVAYINSITPNPVRQGANVTFTGSATDSQSAVVAYKWRSSISGTIGTTATFSTASLPVGTHNIYLSVQDNHGAWSQEASAVLVVEPTVANDPTQNALSQIGNLLILEIVTLAAAAVAAVVAIYGLTRSRRTQKAKL